MKFLDTATEEVVRIKEGRRNINIGITIIFFAFLTSATLLFLSLFYQIVFTFMFFSGVLCILSLILMGVLVLKREIYSLAVLLKEK